MVLILLAGLPGSDLHATGDFGPGPRWLKNGGIAVTKSPEFFWRELVTELAREHLPAEKPVERKLLPPPPDQAWRTEDREDYADHTARMDNADFAEAIQKGYLNPPNADAALAAHRATREELLPTSRSADASDDAPLPAKAINQAVVEAEYDSEFADYHRGALAMKSGNSAQAKIAWERLLALPEGQRRYRSVWAAFMLGKLLLESEPAVASAWFTKCRQMAAAGFADSLGLAADSYGWHAKAELALGHREAAAKLYLAQLSLGDETAFVSLKSLIPDRGEMYGMLSFDLEGRPVPSDDLVSGESADRAAKVEALLAESAKTPTLRHLQTLHVLATETVKDWVYDLDADQGEPDAPSRLQRWLGVIEKSQIDKIDNADKLGWLAYTAGDFAAAERWLALVKQATAHSMWLRAKLLRRTGDLSSATAEMNRVVEVLAAQAKAAPADLLESSEQKTLLNDAYADLAVLHFSQNDYAAALEAFHQGGMREDWAYIAERMLSADELKRWVDQRFPVTSVKADTQGDMLPLGASERHVLARRLVREDRYDEARTYMPPDLLSVLDRYVGFIQKAADTKNSKAARARAWFEAAALLMDSGDRLMATEGEPDNVSRWDTSLDLEREKGQFLVRGTNNQFEAPEPSRPLTLYVPVTAEEKKRLAAHPIVPFRPGHYRYVALALVWKSAALLPDHSDELADVLNTAGNWIKGDYRGDDLAAAKFFQAIERRASKTALGREAGKAHWFVPRFGPWSQPPATE